MYVWLYKRLRKTRLSGVHPVYSGVYNEAFQVYMLVCGARAKLSMYIFEFVVSIWRVYMAIWPWPPSATHRTI